MSMQYLVDMLRRETGFQTLNMAWNPSLHLPFHHRFGGWVVTGKGRYPFCQDGVGYTHDFDVEVYSLDGNHGRPLVPGRWLVHALAESDMGRHGSRRNADMDDIREERVAKKQREKKADASEAGYVAAQTFNAWPELA